MKKSVRIIAVVIVAAAVAAGAYLALRPARVSAAATVTINSSHWARMRAWARIWPGRWKASQGWDRIGRLLLTAVYRARGWAPVKPRPSASARVCTKRSAAP